MTMLRALLAVLFLGSMLGLAACNESDGPINELESGVDHVGDQFD